MSYDYLVGVTSFEFAISLYWYAGQLPSGNSSSKSSKYFQAEVKEGKRHPTYENMD